MRQLRDRLARPRCSTLFHRGSAIAAGLPQSRQVDATPPRSQLRFGSRPQGNAMLSVRVTAAGAVFVVCLSFLTAPARACDDRFIKKCEKASAAAAAAEEAASEPSARRGPQTRESRRVAQREAFALRQADAGAALCVAQRAQAGACLGLRTSRGAAIRIAAGAPLPRLHRSAADRAERLRGAAQAAPDRARFRSRRDRAAGRMPRTRRLRPRRLAGAPVAVATTPKQDKLAAAPLAASSSRRRNRARSRLPDPPSARPPSRSP